MMGIIIDHNYDLMAFLRIHSKAIYHDISEVVAPFEGILSLYSGKIYLHFSFRLMKTYSPMCIPVLNAIIQI